MKKDGTTVSTITDDVGSSTDTNYYHTPSYSSGLQIATGYYIVKSISIEEYDDTYYIANLDGKPLLYIPREDNYEIAPGPTYDIVFAQIYYHSRYSYPLSANSSQIYLESTTESEAIV